VHLRGMVPPGLDPLLGENDDPLAEVDVATPLLPEQFPASPPRELRATESARAFRYIAAP
jgi:hypothetical protein